MGAALPRTRAKRLGDRVWISQSPALPRAGEALVGSSVELHFAESPFQSESQAEQQRGVWAGGAGWGGETR